ATHLAIISQGHLKFEGTPRELQQRSRQMIVVKADPVERAQAILARLGCVVTADGDRLHIEPCEQCDPAQINTKLVQAGVAVSYLATQHLTLEELFLDLTRQTSEKEFAIR